MMSKLFQVVFTCILQLACTSRPSFQQKYPYFFEIQENLPKGHLVGYVNASVANSNQEITYETSTIANDVITIENTTGALYVNGTIDADIPDFHDIQFSVYAYTNPSEKESIKVYVIIIDVNDNAPVFQNEPYKINITEDFPVNTFVTRIRATDVDRKGFSELIYNIQGWTKSSMFFIKEFDGTIWTNKRLDYEKERTHILNVSVTDGRPSDQLRHFVYTTVEIVVNDYDDQGAKFDQYNYYATIQEGIHNFTKLIQVHATDLDKGINAPVTYDIYEASNPGGIYKIDSNTGLVTVQGIIDRETAGSSFYLTVQARSTTHEPATATVVVSINDTNDNAPFFPNNHYTGAVLENSLIGSKVIQISAIDLDEGSNKDLSYSIVGGDGKFDIDSNGFVLVNGSLDREIKDVYRFQVHVVEGITQERFSNLTNVTIFIQDVNDNSPKFEENVFEFEVEEEVIPPLFISQLNATDKDFGSNGFITYSIVPDAESKHEDFDIDPLTGKFWTKRKLDRERIASYSMLIKATDRAAPGQRRETLCTVKVNVKDINDNAPYFSKTDYETSVNEAANLNTIVFALQAEDKDMGENAKLEYEIMPSNVSDYFKIDAASGIIKTSKELDRETIPYFHLIVMVKDGGNKSSSTNVTISVLDINDNSPVFTSLNGYHFNVTEGKQGAFVGVVQAYDIDEGDAGKVKYAITNNEYFAIDSNNGTITTAKKLDRELIDRHKITVVAEDLSKIGSRNSYAQVDITVLDENDNTPQFSNGGDFSTVIRKDSLPGTFVYQFSASDQDISENGEIIYDLPKQFKDIFSLDNSTGILRLQSNISNFANESMAVNIMARDNGNPSLSVSAFLRIYFANILKSAPIFESPLIKTSINENEPKGKLIVDVNAKYNGKSDEQDFRFSIIHGNAKVFQINEENGKITTLKPLDREIASKYILIIMVQLRLQNEANFATVEITVKDENDNPPRFFQEIFTVSLYENQNANTTVTTVTAADNDEGINAKIVYYLNGSSNFIIDKNTGVISTATSLDREDVAKYNLTVTAVNEDAIPKLMANCKVVVNVLDLNDNAPIFDKSIYFANVVENSPVNTSVIQVQARDQDDGINGYIKYDIKENDCFFIEWKTGVIRTTCLIDREKTPSFELTLIAKGIISPPLSSTAKLKVVVVDIDDNHPHFHSKVFRLEPSENLRIGSTLMTFSVVDADTFIGNVSYQVHAGNDEGYFLLNHLTGALTLAKKFDREVKSGFTLVVRVYSRLNLNENAKKKRSIDTSQLPYDQATLFLNIQDVNDNSPHFIKSNYIAAVREDAKFKSFVAKIYANDSDIGDYASMSYSIESGNKNGLFHLDKQSGFVTVYKSLMGDAGNVSKMIIIAKDNNGIVPSNPSTNKATLDVYIIGDDQTGIVLIETTAEYLHSHLYFLESLLGNATNAKVTIDEIKSTTKKNAFHIYFHAIDEGKRHILSKDEILRSILTPNSQYINNQMKKYNVTWYLETKPKAGKSTGGKEASFEVYIGVIAAIAILLIITCAFAIWAAFFKKNGKRNAREILENDTRTNTLETIPSGYSIGSVKSTRSTNRYIIEPYESNENIENDEGVQKTEDESVLHGSPFYTVEPHEEIAIETQRHYLDSSAASQMTQTWAYGETDSVCSEDDIDKIAAEKLSKLNGAQIKRDIGADSEASDGSFFANDILTTGGPLFTSERMVEIVNEKEEVNSDEIIENNQDLPEEGSCEVDEPNDSNDISMPQSSKETLDPNYDLDCANQQTESRDQCFTDDSPIPASSPSFLQFESTEWESTDISLRSSPSFGKDSPLKDANKNDIFKEMAAHDNSTVNSFKTVGVSAENEHMISYL